MASGLILLSFGVFALADGINRSSLPSLGGPMLSFSEPLLTFGIMASGLERGWFSSSPSGRMVLGGTFLLGFTLYWLQAASLERLGVFGASLALLSLITLLPAWAAWRWKESESKK